MKSKLTVSKILRLLLVASMVTLACGSDDDDSTRVVVENPDNEQREEGPLKLRPW